MFYGEPLNSCVKFVFVHCGTNNVDKDRPSNIAESIISIALEIKKTHPHVKVLISGLLPRDREVNSIRRKRIVEVNKCLQERCYADHGLFYMAHDQNWTLPNGKLNSNLYHVDHLHLVEKGYEKFAENISLNLQNIKHFSNNFSALPYPLSNPFTLTDDAIGWSECLGGGWDGVPSQPSFLPPTPCQLQSFPPLPPPLATVSRLHPCLSIQPPTSSHPLPYDDDYPPLPSVNRVMYLML